MSEDTRALWAHAHKHHIPYDTVINALDMVNDNPRLDIYGLLMHPTDGQALSLKCKGMHLAYPS